MQNFDPEKFIAAIGDALKRVENFDPGEFAKAASATMKRAEDFIVRAEQIEANIAALAEKLSPVVTILSPFLPKPVGAAIEDLPELQDQVVKVKSFVNDVLPQVNNLIGAAGTGAAQANGVTLDEAELKPNPEMGSTAP